MQGGRRSPPPHGISCGERRINGGDAARGRDLFSMHNPCIFHAYAPWGPGRLTMIGAGAIREGRRGRAVPSRCGAAHCWARGSIAVAERPRVEGESSRATKNHAPDGGFGETVDLPADVGKICQ